MTISKKAEYAMRAVAAIARASEPRPVQIQELSDSEHIPVKFLEQILLALKRGGILKSKRGVGGGYQMNQRPEDVTLGEIIRLIDGPFAPISSTPAAVGNAPPAGLRPQEAGFYVCFSKLQRMVNEHLDEHTIRDILELERPADSMAFEI